MLHTRLLFLLFLIPAVSVAQLSIINISVADSGNRVLFSCKENVLQISNLPRKAQVTASAGGIEQSIYPGQYNCFGLCRNKANTDTIRVYSADGSLLFSKTFKIIRNTPDGSKNFPLDRNLVLGHIMNDTATITDILADPVLHVQHGDFKFNRCFLSILIRGDPNLYGPFYIEADLGKHETVKKLLEKLSVGGKLFFDDVRFSNGKEYVYTEYFTVSVLPAHTR